MTDNLNEKIARLLKTAGPMKRGQIAAQLGGGISSDRRALRDTLHAMENSKEIIKVSTFMPTIMCVQDTEEMIDACLTIKVRLNVTSAEMRIGCDEEGN